jgi:adenosylmethionine-8-amino-7-oxononanoate aminotransferase
VICGFGRTGHWFGHQHFGVEPDLAPIAKGLSSGYLPIGGVMVSDRVGNVLVEEVGDFNHGFTYSGHPVCAAAALENLRIIEDEKLVERVHGDASRTRKRPASPSATIALQTASCCAPPPTACSSPRRSSSPMPRSMRWLT